MEGLLEELERWTDKREEGIRATVEVDFNARMEREGGGFENEGKGDEEEREKVDNLRTRRWIRREGSW